MKEEIKKYSWKVNVKSKQVNAVVQRPGYRGLLNIGNCKDFFIELAI